MKIFPWIRKPNYPKMVDLDYDKYWESRHFKINDNLKPREAIIYKWIEPNNNVLDLGCGNSRLPLELKIKGMNIEIGDVSKLVINEFSNIGITAHEIDLNGSLKSLLDKRYDYIILSEVLEHLSTPEKTITELNPSTKYFLITIPNSAYFWFRLGLLFRGRFFTQWVHHPSEHLRFWSHIDFLDWLKAMDLQIVKYRASNGIKVLNRIWPNLFGFQIVYLCQTHKYDDAE